MKRSLVGCLAWLSLAACPIPPDFASDAGPGSDGGLDAGAILDSGVADAGASGSIGATVQPSNGTSHALAWNGGDLTQSSIDINTSAGAQQVTLAGSNGLEGNIRLTLGNLTPGATSGQVLSITYQPSSGPDSWSCSSTNGCTSQVTLSAYDGQTIAGNFALSFPIDALGNSAQVTNGSFNVTLP